MTFLNCQGEIELIGWTTMGLCRELASGSSRFENLRIKSIENWSCFISIFLSNFAFIPVGQDSRDIAVSVDEVIIA